jgi:hypothetical protein
MKPCIYSRGPARATESEMPNLAFSKNGMTAGSSKYSHTKSTQAIDGLDLIFSWLAPILDPLTSAHTYLGECWLFIELLINNLQIFQPSTRTSSFAGVTFVEHFGWAPARTFENSLSYHLRSSTQGSLFSEPLPSRHENAK